MKQLKVLMLFACVGWMTAPETQAFYNPSAGRWLSRDPLNERGGANLHSFVANDAVRHWDVLGKLFEGGEWPIPPNRVDPPKGPFSKCRIAVQCGPAKFHGITVGTHCGLVFDVGDGTLYGFNGSGGTINRRDLTSPVDPNDPIGPFTDLDPSRCECIFGNMKPWNDRKVPRQNECANSNWNMKCALKKCNLAVNWGSQPSPTGYDCKECVRWSPPGYSAPGAFACGYCAEEREKPCPDQ